MFRKTDFFDDCRMKHSGLEVLLLRLLLRGHVIKQGVWRGHRINAFFNEFSYSA